jgi:hypothetical protein
VPAFDRNLLRLNGGLTLVVLAAAAVMIGTSTRPAGILDVPAFLLFWAWVLGAPILSILGLLVSLRARPRRKVPATVHGAILVTWLLATVVLPVLGVPGEGLLTSYS